MIIKTITELDEIKENGNHYYPDRIKFCLDRKRKVVAVDEEMHIDMEHELFDDGSEYGDVFGGDIVFSGESPVIVWEAHPNIERNKELEIGKGRELKDQKTIDELMAILVYWIR